MQAFGISTRNIKKQRHRSQTRDKVKIVCKRLPSDFFPSNMDDNQQINQFQSDPFQYGLKTPAFRQIPQEKKKYLYYRKPQTQSYELTKKLATLPLKPTFRQYTREHNRTTKVYTQVGHTHRQKTVNDDNKLAINYTERQKIKFKKQMQIVTQAEQQLFSSKFRKNVLKFFKNDPSQLMKVNSIKLKGLPPIS